MAMPTPAAVLIGFVLEAVLWGTYFNLFAISLVQLWRRYNAFKPLLPLIVANSSLFALCTVHLALEFHRIYTVHDVPIDEVPGAYNVVTLCNLLGQFILFHRCWVLWERNYLTIVPPCGFTLMAFGCLELARHTSTFHAIDATQARTLTVMGHLLMLYANLVIVVTIASKLSQPLLTYLPRWTRPNAPSNMPDGGLPTTEIEQYGVLRIAEESGVGHFVAQVVLVGFVIADHPARDAAAAVVVQLYGIMPTMVALRILFDPDTGSKSFLRNDLESPEGGQAEMTERRDVLMHD